MYKLFIWAAARWLTDIDLFNLLASSAWSIRTYIKFIDPQYLHTLFTKANIRYLDLIQLHTKHIELIYIIGAKQQPSLSLTSLNTDTHLAYYVSIDNPYNLVTDRISNRLYSHSLHITICNHTMYRPNTQHISDNDPAIQYLTGTYLKSKRYCHVISAEKIIIAGPSIVQFMHKGHHIKSFPCLNEQASQLLSKYLLKYTLVNGISAELLSHRPFTLIKQYSLARSIGIHEVIDRSILAYFSVTKNHLQDPTLQQDTDMIRLAITTMQVKVKIMEQLIYYIASHQSLNDISSMFTDHIIKQHIYKVGINENGTKLTSLQDLDHYMCNHSIVKTAIIEPVLAQNINSQSFASLSIKAKYATVTNLIYAKHNQLIYSILDQVQQLERVKLKHTLQLTYIKDSKVKYILDCIYNTEPQCKYKATNLAFDLRSWRVLMSPLITIHKIPRKPQHIPYEVLNKLTIRPNYLAFNAHTWHYFSYKEQHMLSASELTQLRIYDELNLIPPKV
jgi:hypothetical protein